MNAKDEWNFRLNFAAPTWPGFFGGLIPVTIGNILGGGVLVGGVYWFVYSRPRNDQAPSG